MDDYHDEGLHVAGGQWVGAGVIAATFAFTGGEDGSPWMWLPLLAGVGLIAFSLGRNSPRRRGPVL